ncbi:MAG TPA: sensor histidine kinase [Candidatus Dormibacteraeota bacterium]|jgi:signal transduction histidine kinase
MTSLRQRLGLRARMTASYVLVTFAAVILVEALAAVLVIPNVNQQADLASRVVNTANAYARQYENALEKAPAMAAGAEGAKSQDAADASAVELSAIALLRGLPLGDPTRHLRPGEVRTRDDGGVVIPRVTDPLPDSAPMSMALVLSTRGIVLATSYPGRFGVGSAAASWLPAGWTKGISAVTSVAGGTVAWVTDTILPPDGDSPSPEAQPLGYVYIQVPIPATSPVELDALKPLLQTGAIFLLVSIPVGVLFGLLTTRGTITRLRRLAAGTVGFAAGDFSRRVPEGGMDEVGQLERHFNGMAERLSASIAEQRALAERNARLAERSRISRELHDSISQDLFSMSALAGGLRRALPADSALQPQLETLSRTVGATIREMRALLLELRPTALEEKGLVPALCDLCEAYEVRAGVHVRHRLDPVALDAAAEQALFRIAGEGLANAVRHSDAERIDVGLRERDGRVELVIADTGRGFDPETESHGLGLRLMAERVRELGGSLAVDSERGRGTELRVVLPAAGG